MTILLVVFKDYLQIDLQLVMPGFSLVVRCTQYEQSSSGRSHTETFPAEHFIWIVIYGVTHGKQIRREGN